MGAAFNGFSIRDYTNKMRSVDVFKCWPFSTSPNVTSKDLNQWLPPMTLPSSSSSSSSFNQQQSLTSTSTNNHHQQQQSLKSDHQSPPSPSPPPPSPPPPPADEDRLEMVCPVCREFNAATLTAVNAHIDACLAQTVREDRRQMRITTSTSCAATATTTTTFKSSSSSHAKPKAPKKRSIAEIFKVKEPEKEQEQEKELELEKEQEKEKEKEEEEEEEENEEPRIESVLKLWKKDGVEDEDSVVDDVSITVTKFQWLSQRLEALRSGRRGAQSAKSDAVGASGTPAEAMDDDEEEKSEMVCPVCRDFNAATVTAVNAHIDNCLAQAVRDERRQMRKTAGISGGGGGFKHKPKAPKKRSIAEILTVAPPIGATKSKAIEVAKDYDEEDNGDEDKSSDYSGLNSAGAAAADADCDGIVVSTTKNKSTTTTTTKSRKKKKKTTKTKEAKKTKTVSKQLKKKKKRKKSFFNNEVVTTTTSSKKVCGLLLCTIKYKLMFWYMQFVSMI
ncbi:hypothetical protein PIB30_089085 [Stylosanthes scabra]|uniref:UBZ4-type domain-containing protein n=1 Tax=Stylosanthes scabra TaxID=79078 RepID=A0ABU6SUU7_9FABA|nr:hypothetical protein [Stylosanthes scabra]